VPGHDRDVDGVAAPPPGPRHLRLGRHGDDATTAAGVRVGHRRGGAPGDLVAGGGHDHDDLVGGAVGAGEPVGDAVAEVDDAVRAGGDEYGVGAGDCDVAEQRDGDCGGGRDPARRSTVQHASALSAGVSMDA
jgi:hypothetical protein